MEDWQPHLTGLGQHLHRTKSRPTGVDADDAPALNDAFSQDSPKDALLNSNGLAKTLGTIEPDLANEGRALHTGD